MSIILYNFILFNIIALFNILCYNYYMNNAHSNKLATKAHWEQQTPVNDELRNIITPPSEAMRDDMLWYISVNPNKWLDRIERTDDVYEFPYGRIGMLPPALFGNITPDEIELTRELVVPDDEDEIQKMAEEYEAWGWKATGKRKKGGVFPDKATIAAALQRLKGMEYPVDQWTNSASHLQDALRSDKLFMMDVHRTNRINNAALDYDQLNKETASTHKPFESYVLVTTDIPNPDRTYGGTRDTIQLPVGEYGVEAATKLAQATLAINDHVKGSYLLERKINATLDERTTELLATHTARTRERSENGVKDPALHGLKNTITEGVLSVSQVISFLTAEKVEGYESHDELVVALLESNVIEQFTRIIRPGYIGPTSLSGLYVPGALEVKNGKLSLSKQVIEIMNNMRKDYQQQNVAQWALHRTNGDAMPMTLGVTCPAASPHGAIAAIKDVMKALYTAERETGRPRYAYKRAAEMFHATGFGQS